ncbi:MAG: polymer-forming cytoskeletal protein [Acidimicrobiia bacterium]
MTLSRSKARNRITAKHFAVGFVAVLAVALPSLSTLASLVTTDIFIVSEQQPLSEDVYVTSLSGKVDGVIDGDLTIFTGDLTITGRVTGSVAVFSTGSVVVEPTGRIDGSLRGAAVNVTVRGEIGGDLFVSGASIVVEDIGSVTRDAMLFGGTARIEGSVGRDVRGRTLRLVVDGSIGGDLDVATQKLEFGPSAEIDKDVLYRSPVEADLDSEAVIGGTITRLPTQSNFVYGIMLALANVVGFFGFLVAGLVVLWALRRTSSRAVGAVLTRPISSLLVGVLTVVVFPVVVTVLAITLVGLPLAAIGVLIGAGLFVVGPVPAVTALGNRVLIRRGGLFGAFVMGAVLWRLGIWVVPVVGGLIYLLALVWGTGAWVLGALAARRGDPIAPPLLPQSLVVDSQEPLEWDAPLAPGRVSVAGQVGSHVGGELELDDETLEEDVYPPKVDDPDETIDFSGTAVPDIIESADGHDVPDADLTHEQLPDLEDEPSEDPPPDPDPDPPPDSWGLPGR